MIGKTLPRPGFVLALILALMPNFVQAQCSEQEMTAVFVVSGIYPGTDLVLDNLMLMLTAEATYPSDAAMADAITHLQPNEICGYYQVDQAGPYRQYFCPPNETGGAALVDERSGQVVFVGTVSLTETGGATFPVSSSHDWAWPAPPAEPAAAPADFGVMHNLIWPNYPAYPTEEEAVAPVMDFLRNTDVVKSFAECGPYSAAAFVYTSDTCCDFLYEAVCILVVNGHCGPPFNYESVSVDRKSWEGVKALYR